MTREPHNPAKVISALERERDSLAARVSSLEAERPSRDPDRPCEKDHPELVALCALLRQARVPCDGFTPAADAMGEIRRLREKAQEVRRAWDDPRHDFGHVPKGGCDKIEWTEATGHYETNLPCSCGHDALRAAIDALVPPVAPPENTKEARS